MRTRYFAICRASAVGELLPPGRAHGGKAIAPLYRDNTNSAFPPTHRSVVPCADRSAPGRLTSPQRSDKMSFIKTAIVAGGMSLALLTGALAQGGLEPWDIREHSAYFIMMDGKMMRVNVGDKGMAMLIKRARKVPRGTVFVMSGGQLYMVSGAKMFDR